MKKNCFSLLMFCFILISNVFSQEEEIILTIGDHKITRDEFERIYHKNNTSAIYDNKGVEEYLDLFINFKLKVIEAEALGYDTASAFIKELSGYRDQLAKPYLEDKEVTESLIQEAYYRTANQVSASHILIRLDQNASSADTAKAYDKIMEIRKRIIKGEAFDKVAMETSEDQSAKTNGGALGWFGAFRMVYQFEDMAYKTPVGQISMPFRTQFGYHILKNEGIRPTKGKVFISHILFLASKEDSAARIEKEAKLNECYTRLSSGEKFSELVKLYSDDQRSASHGGELGWFGSESFTPEMEKFAFGLQDSGDFSQPIPTDYGWHIFQLLGKSSVEPLDKIKADLEKKIFNDTRSKKVNDAMVDRIIAENNYKEFKENLNPVIEVVDETIYEGKWDPSIAESMIDPVLSFNDKTYLQNEFAQFIAKQKRFNKNLSVSEIVNNRFNDFVKEKAIEFEKENLETKFHDFRNLMKEYHDGILLFNLTDDKVWNKAVKDTAGLEKFYELNKQNYMWGERAFVSVYTFADSVVPSKKVVAIAKKRSSKMISSDEVNKKLGGNDSVIYVTVKDVKLEKDDLSDYSGITWQKGSFAVNEKEIKNEVIYVNNLLQPEPKKLNEAKGLITADYQTYLESEWIKTLREKYKITVNQEVLKKVK